MFYLIGNVRTQNDGKAENEAIQTNNSRTKQKNGRFKEFNPPNGNTHKKT